MCEMKRSTVCWFKISEKEPGFNEDMCLISDGKTVIPAKWISDSYELDGKEVTCKYFLQIAEEGDPDDGAIWAQDYLWWCYLPEPVK